MATTTDRKGKLLSLAFAYVSCCAFVSGLGLRSAERNIHPLHRGYQYDYGDGTFLIDTSVWEENVDVQEEEIHHRRKRSPSTTTAAPTDSLHPTSYYTQLNDSHNQMIVHWAGEGSKVIIALARDSRPNNSSISNLFISRDYGLSFNNIKTKVITPGNLVPIIDHYYNSHVYNAMYIFTDIVHNYIFTTRDYGNTFTTHSIPFKPTTLKLHETDSNYVLGMDKNDTQKRLYLSRNFGVTWTVIQFGVKSFYWGITPYDGPHDMYVERTEANGKGNIIKSTDYFHTAHSLISGIEDFRIDGAYMFATKNQQFFGSPYGTTQQLWVSYKRSGFKNALFSDPAPRYDYYIVDSSEDQVFVVVTQNKTTWQSNLYISDVNGSRYSLSLENVTYYNPKGSHSNTWLRYFTEDSFADVTKIMGLKGVYIASQLKNVSLFNTESQHSLITFDKGGEWSAIRAPPKDIDGNPTNCSLHLYRPSLNCSLHVTQEFSRLYPGGRTVPILSRESAPGLILATGTIGASLKRNPDVYISTDAGVNWNPALKGNNFYAFGDHGGIIVSVPQFQATNTLYYSWNEGETWHAYNFHTDNIRVYGVLTEPGETTGVFSLFGSHLSHHQWLIVQVNVSKIFETKCSDDDYKEWSFEDQSSGSCILGRKLLIERRNAHSKCFNGLEYEREITEKNCSCRRDDYECDYGFKLQESSFFFTSQTCVPDNSSGVDVHAVPYPCPVGTFYPYTRGYRKVPGDTCEGGQAYRYDPLSYSCPLEGSSEFILYCTRNAVHRIRLDDSDSDELLYSAHDSTDILAVEYDYHDDCLFFADNSDDSIKKLCFGDNETMMTIISTGLQVVESLQYDWSSKNLFWLDAGLKKIEVAKSDGRYRKVLYNNTYFDRPRALTLDPHYGYLYWTDWSSTNPRIMRASMDGDKSSVEMLVNGSSNVHWPNGVTIDHSQFRMYWTDASLKKIFSADLNGSDVRVILHGSYYLPHPYAIDVFKNNLYWTDWTKEAILTADKMTGAGIRTIKGDLRNVMDLKILSRTSQSDSTLCSRPDNAGCSQLCLPHPQKDNPNTSNRTCLCGDQYDKHKFESGNDERCDCKSHDSSCAHNTTVSNCSASHFTCTNGRCIPLTWVCDHDNDCHDGSDEIDCTYKGCQEGLFTCNNSRCIPQRWRCDYDDDCNDGSDESGCSYRACNGTEFRCATGKCIPGTWKCDGDNDCHDFSDEQNCHFNETCLSYEFQCASNASECISRLSRCDGHRDCSDGSDEVNCTSCPSYKFRCNNGSCVYRSWLCDGKDDCHDGSDEHNCATTTYIPPRTTTGECREFLCHNMRCVRNYQVCDGINDCGDDSDEFNCRTSTPPARTTAPSGCGPNEFRCRSIDGSDRCIPSNWVCDNYTDCAYGEDESDCHVINVCQPGYFTCGTVEGCVQQSHVCDHRKDCADGSDEFGCSYLTTTAITPQKCTDDRFFHCDWFNKCILKLYTCEFLNPCIFMSYPSICQKRANVTNLATTSVTGKSISISWDKPKETNLGPFKYIVTYLESSDETTWQNTSSMTATSYVLKNLRPLTEYTISVYAVSTKSSKSYPPVFPLMVSTEEDVPAAPIQVKLNVKENDTSHVILSWRFPLSSPGDITAFNVYWMKTSTKEKQQASVEPNIQTYMFGPEILHFGVKYEFWVTAVNQAGEGAESSHKTLIYDEHAVANRVTGLSAKTQEFTLKLSWKAPANETNVKGYRIMYTDSWHAEVENTTDNTSFTISNLCPGNFYSVSVVPYNDHGDGPLTQGIFQTKGVSIGSPTNFHFDRNSTKKFLVSWNKPQNLDTGVKHWQYTVYYDYNSRDMVEERTIEEKASKLVATDTTQVSLDKLLLACESYTVRVALTSPGKCTLSQSIDLTTGSDEKAPPKKIQTTWEKTKYTRFNLTWEAPCEHQFDALGYMVQLQEVNTSKVWKFQKYKATKDIQLWQEIFPVTRGATYTIKIRTHVEGSRWSENITVQSRPYGSPWNIRLTPLVNKELLLTWDPPAKEDYPAKFKGYEVFLKVNAGSGKSETGVYNLYQTVQGTSTSYRVPDGDSKIYWFKVRLAKVDGYPGSWSEDVHIPASAVEGSIAGGSHSPNAKSVTLTNTNMIAIIVSVTAIVIAFVVVLAFFIVRHRRLQRSFLAFANSHYDTRSGTTTFSAADDIGEEEEPMIQGFSDDEPLVIA